MNRYLIILIILLSLFRSQNIQAQPNILLIVADDLGWKDVGWHNGSFQTPNMDKLVKEGVELD